MKKLIVVVLLIMSVNASYAQKLSKELKQLKENLSGRFTNEDQARFNPSYKPQSFIMKQILLENPDGLWMYGELASVDSVKFPKKQFIWHFQQVDQNRFAAQIFQLNDPKSFVNDWQKKIPLQGITEAMMVKELCPLYLVRKTMIEFTGATREKFCRPVKDGKIAYKTIELYSSESTLMYWERGYNASDKLVDGPEQAGDIFRKIEQFK
ncbi:chromophore lyase CpcT/CpeT [Solitalea canadensis]|uniref:CpeT/CpcT family (DUF1001) n=1 Tax=Solitalea canadensis (strain ATCC 29591 / DSM 3403 / JCM 21819 / LMG 8368 / NBRC 15130 / NCIMB 12057 / USAM 9D) TaxID=929556 RepID=H8KNA1_SOLCM|nr:chromophore lyase CpcT/CpeT [Solitalea canadensis]AFD09434.1 CpeT/CpcT family (DUF1001) [Solitalea canadensis DSM 3403]